ncbi:MAG: TetR/AcrR family transcriptional regulator [Lautropia sp.]|nr:TetR/AcrR family transcriptional regulator [Lautropia sp.]
MPADSLPSDSAAIPPAAKRRPRGPRWERRKDSRPSELLEAALESFVERGFAAARLDDVAAKAGVSKGTLYLYYANKEELFKAVVRRSIAPLIAETREIIEQSDRDSEALLAQFLNIWWTRYGGTRLSGITKLVISEAGNFPEMARFYNGEVVKGNHDLITMILKRGVARNEFREIDVDAVAHHVMAPLVLRSIWANSIEPCCGSAGEMDSQHFLAHHLDMLLRALREVPAAGTGSASGQ